MAVWHLELLLETFLSTDSIYNEVACEQASRVICLYHQELVNHSKTIKKQINAHARV